MKRRVCLGSHAEDAHGLPGGVSRFLLPGRPAHPSSGILQRPTPPKDAGAEFFKGNVAIRQKAAVPVQVGLLRAAGVVAQADDLAQPLQPRSIVHEGLRCAGEPSVPALAPRY